MKLLNNPLPLHAHIEISGRCQLDCAFCSKELRYSEKSAMNFHDFQAILDAIPTLKSITLALMNEPLLNPDIAAIVTLSKKRNIKVGIPSNGVTFPEELQQELLYAGLDAITFSVDSHDPEIYHQIRHPASLETVQANLSSFIKSRNQQAASCRVGVSAVLHVPLLNNLEAFVSHWCLLGVDSVELRFPHQWKASEEMNMQKVDILQALKKLYELKRRFGRRINFYHFPVRLGRISCPRVFNTTAIKVNGEVVPCCLQASDPKRCSLGNVFRTPFDKIWDALSYRLFRQPFLKGFAPAICEGCTVLTGLNGNPVEGRAAFLIRKSTQFLYEKRCFKLR
ncbi:MAG: hypothetical protein A2293_01305 [Elusimicrobia bacterium RIFOXYB2_FULL_49_7]|nr:MAG: hypothetical protein A2293_01305 [Elusimicrobia bacterium RIFOXYB2_FULL_49_7]